MAASGTVYLRSLLLVSLVLSVSSASHVLAAGHLPDIGVIALIGALLLVPMTLISRRALSFRSSLLAMGAGQLLLHTLFGMTALPAVCQSSSAMPGHHTAFELACRPAAQAPLDAVTADLSMLLLHGVATVILAVTLSRSDAATELLLAWLRPLFGSVPAPALLSAVPEDLVAAVFSPVAPLPVHATVPSLRGPPSSLSLRA